MLNNLKPQPEDKIIGLAKLYRADERKHKIDLGVGVYRDAEGRTPVMAAVKAALVDKFQISPEVAAEIVEVVKEAMAPTEEVEAAEEEKEEMKEEKPVEMSAQLSDITDQMTVALEAISARLAKLEEAPAASPDRVLPKAEFSKEINPNLTGVDRAFNVISQFS